jgi:hypothetical protein
MFARYFLQKTTVNVGSKVRPPIATEAADAGTAWLLRRWLGDNYTSAV